MSITPLQKMQYKISAFFKPPSPSASASSVSLPHDNEDQLSTWENKQHHIFITYRKRTRPNPNTVCSSSKPESTTITGTTVVKNKKRSYAQFHLDFGQSDFLLRTCSTCGLKFTPGDADGEKSHKDFHKRYTHGVQFRVTTAPNSPLLFCSIYRWCNSQFSPNCVVHCRVGT